MRAGIAEADTTEIRRTNSSIRGDRDVTVDAIVVGPRRVERTVLVILDGEISDSRRR